jgi:hypothetical protein
VLDGARPSVLDICRGEDQNSPGPMRSKWGKSPSLSYATATTTGTTRSVVPGIKVAVGAVSEGLRQELLEDGIRITQGSSLSPLGTVTPTRARG